MTTPPRRALLLSGGLGTRLRPLTDTTPKCLIPIKGKPVLEYWLDMLLNAGVQRVLVNTHYLPEQVREYCAASRWSDQIDLVHEDQLLGTAGTLRANHKYFRDTGTFFSPMPTISRSLIQMHILLPTRRDPEAVMAP